MRATEVEQWCATVVDQLQRGRRVEDDRVELKRQLPSGDATKSARRIAGHANQARSDRILWIIGAEEDPIPRVCGSSAAEQDVADWWVPVEARFDDVAPSPTIVRMAVDDDQAIVGVGFDTTRPPYVIKHSLEAPNREVPWREGTRIRSANRFDLLRILAPVVARPRVAHLESWLTLRPKWVPPSEDSVPQLEWQGSLVLYLDTERPLILPDHRCRAVLTTKSQRIDLVVVPYVGRAQSWKDNTPAGRLADRGDGQLLVGGSAAIMFQVSGESDPSLANSLLRSKRARIELEFEEAGLDPVSFKQVIELAQQEREKESATWRSASE